LWGQMAPTDRQNDFSSLSGSGCERDALLELGTAR
jgi:hypothetical protein